jgi:prepilin-type N-terminal cleavage/methylation domain-containing protein
MKKGFTLLELIVVIIIVGILATLGFAQYTRMIEKGRTTEARSNLGVLRQQQIAWFQEHSPNYASITDLDVGLPDAGGAGCNSQFYFQYSCDAGTGTCTATRCTGGGKEPQSTAADTLTLAVDGTWGGSIAGW